MQRHFPHLIDLDNYPVSSWNDIIDLAIDIKRNKHIYVGACNGKIMATLFYEPSTRTQMSFQSAMLRLGGGIIGFDNPATSSVAKGESIKDTTKIASSYSDIIVMRHFVEGSVKAAALTADCPVVNAGDGGHLHPTQTLTDLLTLKAEKGTLSGLTVGFCGDLKNGRTVHSLLKALSCYDNNKFVLISTNELKVPTYIKDRISASGKEYIEVNSLEEAIPELDVLYMTRIQRERFGSPEEYERQKNVFCLDAQKMRAAKKDMIVLHPLPRVDEITLEVDDDPRALYFKQANYGMYVRMSLILSILNEDISTKPLLVGKEMPDIKCSNPKCITNMENTLKGSFRNHGGILECEFCDERLLME
ncbi:MAG: aspartate carbamoyltransferase [Lachnospiraceae bacterium]|nr:aspartate carbamoyltransferase [Lachnospiraceae bacterium]